jgi:hypothetical protein
MPVHQSKPTWYWVCSACKKIHGVFGSERDAEKDLNIRHAKVCSERTSTE